VTISAGTAVNIKQPIVNIKTGSDLSITAGTDINVAAQIDGRDGSRPEGAVTMVAGNKHCSGQQHRDTGRADRPYSDERHHRHRPWQADSRWQRTDQVTNGGDFSTGTAPPEIPDPGTGVPFTYQEGLDYVRNFLKQYVTMVTTGSLDIKSRNGNVNVDAPISDATGAVTLTAGNAINVNQKINSNNAPIVRNAGASWHPP
jgi:hypothetical protein